MSGLGAYSRSRRSAGWCLLAGVLMMFLLGCGGSSRPLAGSSTLPVVTDPFGGSTPPLSVAGDASDPKALAVLDAAAGQIHLDPEQRGCVAARLDQDRDLLKALGSDPVGSARFGDLASLAQDCINSVSFSSSMVASLQVQAGGSLSANQLSCLRQGFSGLSGADVSAMVTAGLEPGTSIDGDGVGPRLDAIYGGCGVDRSKLAPATP
jgi:hypothetical protein